MLNIIYSIYLYIVHFSFDDNDLIIICLGLLVKGNAWSQRSMLHFRKVNLIVGLIVGLPNTPLC